MRACVSHGLEAQGGKDYFEKGKGKKRQKRRRESCRRRREREKESIKRVFVMSA